VEKQLKCLKSLSVVMAVMIAMTAGGYFLLTGGEETMQSGLVEAAIFAQVEEKQDDSLPQPEAAEEVEEEVNKQEKRDEDYETEISESVQSKPVVENKTAPAAPDVAEAPVEEKSIPVVKNASSAPVDYKAESTPVETVTEAPAAQPVVREESPEKFEEPQLTAAPVSYNWGTSANYVFRMEVKVSNNGGETSRNVSISVPLLENSSPYQITSLKAVNYDIVGTSGRVSTFNLGDIAPGETKTIVADFDINVRTLSLNSSNDTVERARKIYEQYAGSGNCRDLALAFISKCSTEGITAREVIGYARAQRGAMSPGTLQGSRHSWAEFYVEGLGWVPVDLTFQYFGSFPHASHLVESYSDQSIKVNFTGGSLSASWINAVM
jgi:hypothetical protein